MAFLRSVALALLLLAAPPALAGTGEAAPWLYEGSDLPADPAWRFGTLDNGLRYAIRRNPRPEGQVSIRLRIDAGALNEEDGERGFAHFVEHMLFRGTAAYPDTRARQIWQELGASFGSDTNASTSATQTVYQLDLPNAAPDSLDLSLAVLADMMANARFDPEAVEAERRVVLAEKGRRPELTARLQEASSELFYAGLRFAERDTIGTEETLRAATAEGLKAFYGRWYRPDRTILVVAGDADPELLERLVRGRFADWRAETPQPSEPDPGAIAELDDRVATIVYEGAPTTASLIWLRDYDPSPHTGRREREALEQAVAARILNRRLEAHARGESAFISAAIGASNSRGIADVTQMNVVARDGGWREALAESFAIVRDATLAPPSEAEIGRELSNFRTALDAAVESEPTILSQVHASRLVSAADDRNVVSAAAQLRERFEENAPLMTPERVGAAMAALFAGTGPRMILVSPEPLAGGEEAAETALAAAEAIAPAARRAERTVGIDDLPPLGAPGTEVSRERVEDLDVTLVRFANGSTLTFKRTPFEQGTVHVRLRFGDGLAGLSPSAPSLAWLGGLVGPSGLAGLDLDAVERMLTGRRMGMSFGVGEEAFVLSGKTSAGELEDQLRLLATKLAHPRWDPALFARFRSSALESFDLHFSSASARASRELAGFVRPGDERWRPVPKERMAEVTVEEFAAYFEPLLAAGPVHAVVVGDVDLDRAVAAMERTVGALPPRAGRPAAEDARAVLPPAPDPQPARFTHRGDPDQAYALIGWSTLGGLDQRRERRALGVAANLAKARLFERLREREGATYAPDASHSTSEEFPRWGIFYAAAEIRPESADTFFRIAREVVADLAARPVSDEEFARAINPVVSGVERRLATNGYWVAALEGWLDDPREIETVRTYLSDYRSLTPEDVRAAMARWVADEGDWSMLVLPEAEAGDGR